MTSFSVVARTMSANWTLVVIKRLGDGGERGREQRKSQKSRVCVSDGKKKMTTKRMGGKKKVGKCRKRDRGSAFREKLVSVCRSGTGSCVFVFTQNIWGTEKIQQCARRKRLQT